MDTNKIRYTHRTAVVIIHFLEQSDGRLDVRRRRLHFQQPVQHEALPGVEVLGCLRGGLLHQVDLARVGLTLRGARFVQKF